MARSSPHVSRAKASPACDDVLRRMASLGSARAIAMQKHFGIRGVKSFGLSAPKLHALAKAIGRSHVLAEELWRTGIHDAHHLAALVDEPARVTDEQMERWARDFNSWDVVDTCCRYLFLYTPYAWKKAVEWSKRAEEFVKRAAFSQMAYLAQHDKKAPDGKFIRLLPIIRRAAVDERNFVRKAVNWALRQIGKRNLALNRRAIAAAKQIRALDSRAARWIAADALRELQSGAVQKRLQKKNGQRLPRRVK
jgi:3-methyladenine DNA glycosylase AlkD